MELILHKTFINQDITDGYLTIGGQKICDTTERTEFMLPPGCYPLTRKCFFIAHGNGAYALHGPQIIVGKSHCRGLVINSRKTYLRIYERLKKAFARNEEVVLVVPPITGLRTS